MLGPLLFILGATMLIVGLLSAKFGSKKVKNVPSLQQPADEDVLYYEDKEAYYRKLGVFTEAEVQEMMEEEREADLDYERMKEELYGKK